MMSFHINTSLNDVNYILYDMQGRVLQSGEGVKEKKLISQTIQTQSVFT